jgi:RNA polymerase sigma-70 factor (ECF subfamily)
MEKALLDKLVSGDRDAFSVIFSAYYRDLVLFAINIVHDRDTAEEIVQDNFVKIWEERRDLNITASLKSYMLRSVQNRCIDWYRHKKIRQAHSDEVTTSQILFEYDTENYLFGSELESLIKKTLSVIPSDYSEAFRMSREEGLKYSEIAEKLNVSVRTIEVRVSKALHLLREHLKDYLS